MNLAITPRQKEYQVQWPGGGSRRDIMGLKSKEREIL